MKTILVTGASGFIGRFLLKELLKKGHQVFALLRQPEPQLAVLKTWLDQQKVDSSQLYAIRGDLSQENAGISASDWQVMQQVTVIYHTAALFAWNLDVNTARQINVIGVLTLLKLAQQQLRIERVVQVSGYMLSIDKNIRQLGISYEGEHHDWLEVYQQVGVYEASKIEAHFAIKRWAAKMNIPLTVIHPATVVGDSQTGELASNQGFYQTLVDLFAGKLTAVPAGQGYRLPLVSVDYVAEFLANVIDYNQSIGQEYVLADNKTPDLKTVLTLCARSVNIAPPRLAVPIPVLRILLKSPWVAQKTGLSTEILHFFRQESLKVDTANQLAMTMGLSQLDLTQVLAKTTQFVQRGRLGILPS